MAHSRDVVRRGGCNEISDVAVFQAAPELARPRAGGPLWTGAIDGKRSPAIEPAICALESAERLPVTGRVSRIGLSMTVLDRILPPGHKGLRGVPGIPVVAMPLPRQAEPAGHRFPG